MQHRPLKKFGQNFLTQPAIAQKIVDALQITGEDQIIEIGPGKGILTDLIVEKQPAIFTAIEIDRNLAKEITTKYHDHLTLIEQDFLQLNLSEIFSPERKAKIVGNIPYNITSPILFKLIDHFREINCVVLMMQKDCIRALTWSILKHQSP